jgi:hypothetical protein
VVFYHLTTTVPVIAGQRCLHQDPRAARYGNTYNVQTKTFQVTYASI